MTTPAPAKPDWHRAAQVATFDGRPFIGGAARSPRSRASLNTLSPFTGQPPATFPAANADDTDRPVLAAPRRISDVLPPAGPERRPGQSGALAAGAHAHHHARAPMDIP